MRGTMGYWEQIFVNLVVFLIRFLCVPVTTLRQLLVSLNMALKDLEELASCFDKTRSLTASSIEDESEKI